MDLARIGFDAFYDWRKPKVFRDTEDDPKRAHESFSKLCRYLGLSRLDRFVLNNESNYKKPPFELSNAAGFNKDAQFHPRVLKYLGFDRVVVGTVTGNPWEGNPRPSIIRFPETDSMVNWEGLPGIGAQRVAGRLWSYGNHEVPLTINFMSTPGKEGDELLRDLEDTISSTRGILYVNRFELDISCQNTYNSDGKIDMRDENLKMLDEMLKKLDTWVLPFQEIHLKVSPDSTGEHVRDTLDIAGKHRVHGIVTTNTTTNHDPRYILNSPGKGGASGKAVWERSLATQILYKKEIDNRNFKLSLIAAGGITPENVKVRLDNGATGIQIYTPFVFRGPRIVRELRNYAG